MRSEPVEHCPPPLRTFAAAHEGAVGQLRWNADLACRYARPGTASGVAWGSGTLIARDLFLTAGHCFDRTGGRWLRPLDDRTGDVIGSAEIATNMHVAFNYQLDPAGELRPTHCYRIVELVEHRPGELDVAIVRLAGAPGAAWGVAELAPTGARPGEAVCLIGHPLGFTKHLVAGRCVAAGGTALRYLGAATFEGSSGSGVLRISDGRLVGVHTNGRSGAGTSSGVCVSALIARSPTLQLVSRAAAAGGTAARPCSAPRPRRSP
ncbi:serine protease [Sorangium sp. So ce327]|uniref:trypsin-like serine peptidase n=1 Tax=unclassified Sorangium TaxID=2621164 RepID=UPI003F64875C